VLTVRLKKLLSKVISPEQFGFLEGQQIQEAIGSAQGLYYIKTKHVSAMMIKLDLRHMTECASTI